VFRKGIGSSGIAGDGDRIGVTNYGYAVCFAAACCAGISDLPGGCRAYSSSAEEAWISGPEAGVVDVFCDGFFQLDGATNSGSG